MFNRVQVLSAMLGVTATACLSTAAVSTPLYNWNFNGGSGAPVTTGGAGGGVLSVTSGTNYSNASFTGADVGGSASSNSYVSADASYVTTDLSSANSTPLTTVPSLGGQITVTAWIKLPNNDVNTGSGKIFYIDTGTNAFGNPVYFSLNTSAQTTNQSPTGTGAGGRLQVNINNVNPNFATSLNGTTYQGNISAGQIDTVPGTADTAWHFVAFTFDSAVANTVGNLNFYTTTLGGTVTNIGTGYIAATLADITGSQTYVTLGNNATTAASTALTTTQGRPLDGNIDDVRLYAGVATLADLQAIANVQSPEPATMGLFAIAATIGLTRRRRHA